MKLLSGKLFANPRLKKITIIAILLVSTPIAAVITISLFLLAVNTFMCSTEVGERHYSPDSAYYFRVEQFGCGATTSYYSDVMLHKVVTGINLPMRNKSSVYGYEGRYDMVRAQWIGNRVIQVETNCSKSRGERDSSWEDVEVRYLDLCSD